MKLCEIINSIVIPITLLSVNAHDRALPFQECTKTMIVSQ